MGQLNVLYVFILNGTWVFKCKVITLLIIPTIYASSLQFWVSITGVVGREIYSSTSARPLCANIRPGRMCNCLGSSKWWLAAEAHLVAPVAATLRSSSDDWHEPWNRGLYPGLLPQSFKPMYENRQAYVSRLNDTTYEGKKVTWDSPIPSFLLLMNICSRSQESMLNRLLIFVRNKKLGKGPYRDYPINANYPSWQLFSYQTAYES